MGLLLDALLSIAIAGIGRGRRAPRPVTPVVPTPWLAIGVASVAGHALVLVVSVLYLARFSFGLLEQDLLMVLGILFLPVALVGMACAVAAVGWLVSVARDLIACDHAARTELAVASATGFMGAVFAGWLVGLALGLVLSIPAVVGAIVASVPGAWVRPGRPADSPLMY